jgi:PadR family transcriptional regulator, regulatory protein AphA
MSLRHALLALLEAGPMTGYELAKQFDVSVDYLWHAPHSQIYPELRRMEAVGLVEAESLPRGERATKRPYSLTAAGAEELVAWIRLQETAPPVRDPAYLRATYFEYESFEETRRHFQEHRDHYRSVLEHWLRHVTRLQQHATALISRRLERAPEEAREAIVAFKVHAYDGLIERARAEIAWAERGLALVDGLEHGSSIPAHEPVLRPFVLRRKDEESVEI